MIAISFLLLVLGVACGELASGPVLRFLATVLLLGGLATGGHALRVKQRTAKGEG
jgi:hypothetical protein